MKLCSSLCLLLGLLALGCHGQAVTGEALQTGLQLALAHAHTIRATQHQGWSDSWSLPCSWPRI